MQDEWKRKAVTNDDISDQKNQRFLFSCVFTELRSGKAVLPQSDSHALLKTIVCSDGRARTVLRTPDT